MQTQRRAAAGLHGEEEAPHPSPDFWFTGDDSAWIDPFGNSQCATLCVSGVIHARQRSSRGWIVDALTQDDGMLTTTSAEDCTALLGRSSSTAKEVVSRPEIPHSSYVRSMYDSVCCTPTQSMRILDSSLNWKLRMHAVLFGPQS